MIVFKNWDLFEEFVLEDTSVVQHEKAICFVGKIYVRPEKRNIGGSYYRMFPQSAKLTFCF